MLFSNYSLSLFFAWSNYLTSSGIKRFIIILIACPVLMGDKFLTLTSDSLLSAITMTAGESVNISLQNASNPASAVEIDVSIQDITLEDAFFHVIRLDFENAANVKITLKDAAGVNVSTLEVMLIFMKTVKV